MTPHRMFTTAGISVAMLLVAAGTGCRGEPVGEEPATTAPKPAEGTPPQVEPPPRAPGQQPRERQAADADLAIITVTRVDVDTKLANMCGLDASAVFFNFDSATLRPEAKERLDKIVECATTGAAKGMELRVIGRTDPVGPDEYNQQLGMSRADSVAKYLQEQGVKQARTETVSKGEQAAEVTDPLRWPLDRRVTIRLADQAQPGQPQ